MKRSIFLLTQRRPCQREILKMFGERAVPAKDKNSCVLLCDCLEWLSFELKDNEMFTYTSSVQEQAGRGHGSDMCKYLIIQSENFYFLRK